MAMVLDVIEDRENGRYDRGRNDRWHQVALTPGMAVLLPVRHRDRRKQRT